MESLKIKSLCVICKFSYPHIVASLTSVSDSTDEEPLEKKIKLQQTNEEIKKKVATEDLLYLNKWRKKASA